MAWLSASSLACRCSSHAVRVPTVVIDVNLPPFQTLIDEHGEVVLRVCTALVGRQDAEDCWQETFLAALAAYPRLRHADNLRGWLTTIAHHQATDHLRGRRRRPLATGELPETPVTDDPAVDHDDGLWDAVASLPDKQRLAVAYRFVADLSYRQVGELLETSEAAARRSAFEAVRKLRERGL